ncbi:hypothetical protein N7509_004083 [Penicillium cosmopolitanum]|uniref:Uncharacterized protein n=1 Tax=Penicillium cosmopolitanum TaxID=1131564 RepID=A0A9W9W6C0_9EURO|nr:uncharacterized protein N7509_004083 [Penicillium cosmopolitanum]KAJ5404212.1 hypothetical protein N7509_004083 [Penicillium cosmopolitanum]
MFKTYLRFDYIKVAVLQIDQTNLNTKYILDSMAARQDNSLILLYIYTVQRVLREIRIIQ